MVLPKSANKAKEKSEIAKILMCSSLNIKVSGHGSPLNKKNIWKMIVPQIIKNIQYWICNVQWQIYQLYQDVNC